MILAINRCRNSNDAGYLNSKESLCVKTVVFHNINILEK